jgi:non-ribosomal peptide synthase protein (TIGR01720 family)
VVLLDLGRATPARLLLVAHHLVIDGVSWRILIEDLRTAYEQLAAGGPARLPLGTTSLRKWALRLVEYARSTDARAELPYWLETASAEVPRLPVDDPEGRDDVGASWTVWYGLEEEDSRALLHDVPAVYHTQINDVLLTALAQTFAGWTGSRRLLIDLEGHGREPLFDDVDLSCTIGWFTSVFPFVLDLRGAFGPGEQLVAIRDQLRRVPHHGIGYGILRYLGAPEDATRLRDGAAAEVNFNYLGQFDQLLSSSTLFKPARESSGPTRSPLQARSHALEINCLVTDARLEVGWTFSSARYRRDTIETLAHAYLEALRGLIRHCRTHALGSLTPADFPLAGLDQHQLDRLVGRFGQAR